MSASVVEARLQFHLLFWYGVMTVAVLFTGMLLAVDLYVIAFLLAATGWLLTLPYHGKISVILSLATFRAAFIMPFVPGRPALWEIGALLAWTGVPISILLRKYPRDTEEIIRENRWVFLGAVFYSLVLLVTMKARGVGFGALGGSTGGGRFYLQQILSAIFPFIFVMVPLKEKVFSRLVIIQLVLTSTYIVSDFAFSVFPLTAQPLLYFLELTTDAANYEKRMLGFGIRRYQSLGWFFPNVIYLLLILYHSRDFFGRRLFWLIPLMLGSVAVSLLSGSRSILVITPAVVLILLWAERFFDTRKLILGGLLAFFALVLVYGNTQHMPLSVQRAVSFLPGIHVDSQAANDAQSTLVVRRILARLGWRMVPQYLWLGRGFSVDLTHMRRTGYEATIEVHLATGRFYNGLIGLLVNTGLLGTLGFLMFIYGGSKIALRVLGMVRRHGAETVLFRIGVLMAAMWLVDVFFFFFLHGDAEQGLRRFGLQAGALLAVERLIRERIARETAAAEAESPEEFPALSG